VPASSLLCVGSAVTEHFAPGYDQSPSAIGAALAGLARHGELCYVTPKDTWACPTPKTCGEALIAYKIAATPPDLARHARAARDPGPDERTQPARYASTGTSSRSLARIPERRPANTTTKPCRPHTQKNRILPLNVRPKHCPMQDKITDEDLAAIGRRA